MSTGSFEYVFKYIIIGDPSVGKSCILNQFLNNNFNEDYDITVGVEFGAQTIDLGDKKVKLQIWDTAGQESFKSITRAYYRGAAAALICYDITNHESFGNLYSWLDECKTNGNPEMTLVLVGNKIDLADNREVSTEEGRQFAEENEMLFFETSAKTAQKVGDLFQKSASKIYEKIEKGVIDPKNESYGVKFGTMYNHNNNINSNSLKRKKKTSGDSDGGCCN